MSSEPLSNATDRSSSIATAGQSLSAVSAVLGARSRQPPVPEVSQERCWHSLWLLLLLASLSGCHRRTEPVTQVVVDVDVEAAILAAADQVRIEVHSGATFEELLTSSQVRFDENFNPATFPRRLPLLPQGGDASRKYMVTATALRNLDQIAQVRLVSGYVAREVRRVELLLQDACRDVWCEGALESCHEGACVSAVVEANALAPWTPDLAVLEAGVSMCVADAGPCCTATCTMSGAETQDSGASDLCEQTCPTDTPSCDVAAGECTQCSSDATCRNLAAGSGPYCVANACVACRAAADCPDGLPSEQAACLAGECRYTLNPGWVDAGRDSFGEWASFEVKGLAVIMRYIPAGTFVMGSPAAEPGRAAGEEQHEVVLTQDYWLGETEVTQALWQAVMDENPSHFVSADRPVENVSWRDVKDFVRALNDSVAGGALRLPTESEWEYACRAGTTTATYADELETLDNYNAPALDAIAWYRGTSDNINLENGTDSSGSQQDQDNPVLAGTWPVAKKKRNLWGLYDTLGNVREWCFDRLDDYPTGQVVNPCGADKGSIRAHRGGSWLDAAEATRAAHRDGDRSGYKHSKLGFRLARGPTGCR